MDDIFYKKNLVCPICSLKFSSLKIKTKSIKAQGKDEDFCVYYKNENPMFYEIFICPGCGYGASENSFNDIGASEKEELTKNFLGREIGRDFCDVRDHKDALDSFKIALFTAGLKKARPSIIGGLALKTAWMYRYIKDEAEFYFLEMALENYKAAYDNESFDGNGMDILTVIYLIGEISRRLGLYEEAIIWFNRLISHPDKDKNPRIEKFAREQWRKTREEMKSVK